MPCSTSLCSSQSLCHSSVPPRSRVHARRSGGETVWSEPVAALATITGDHAISVGECGRTGEGAGRRDRWEQRQTSSIPELCAHIFLSLSSRVSSADATARSKGLLLFLLSLPLWASLRPLAEGVCVCGPGLDLKYHRQGKSGLGHTGTLLLSFKGNATLSSRADDLRNNLL